MNAADALNGALLVDKPAGPTSHDIVDVVRSHFGARKVGHCGTLDPLATGVLVLVFGQATKLSERLMSDDKIYAGIARFGEVTDSYDAAGTVLERAQIPALTLDQLNEAAAQFKGDQMQQPPMVSAVKVGGVPLYKLARKGQEIERSPRLIHVYRFRFSEFQTPLGTFKVACTKGTYVRSLVHELGKAIGCGAHLTALRRTASGKFDVSHAIQFEELVKLSPSELSSRIIPIPRILSEIAGV